MVNHSIIRAIPLVWRSTHNVEPSTIARKFCSTRIMATTQHPAEAFIDFSNYARSRYHAAEFAAKTLASIGYERLYENDDWSSKIAPGKKFYVVRNQSSIIGFAIGGKWKPGNGFNIVGCHTDSPCLKVKPISKLTKNGILQIGVETYGGGLWHTWFDRDLTLAGRVFVKEGDKYVSKLVHIKRPICRIPNLAIHLNRDVNEKGFQINKEIHLRAMIGTVAKAQLDGASSGKHHPALLQVIADELSCNIEDIVNFDLCLVDFMPALLGGVQNEFVSSPHLDNLCMSWCSLEALKRTSDASLASEVGVRCIALFDHEEVGSQSMMGADGNFLQQVIIRVSGEKHFGIAVKNSLLVSADMAHAIHPNYPEKHEENHQPAFGQGIVIKWNTNQRYATTQESSMAIVEIAKANNIPYQEFCVRQDMGCGSTIGPMLSASLGIKTVDVGAPQLAMHSLRETMAADDITHSVNILEAFFRDYSKLQTRIVAESF